MGRAPKSKAPKSPISLSRVAEVPTWTHAVASQVFVGVFAELGLSASLIHAGIWHPIHNHVSPHSDLVSDVVAFELAHGVERRRTAYNEASVRRARREGGPVLTEHAGFHDLFVPIGDWGMLVTGPFETARPTSADLRTRWRHITGHNARPSDPEFARYLETTLATATLEARHLAFFRRWLECFALVLSGEGRAEPVVREAHALRLKLREVRYAERMWSSVRRMLDEGVWRGWQGSYLAKDLLRMGLKRIPQHAMVGLLVGHERDMDPIEERLRRDGFQRACVALVKARGGVICGRVGEHGLVLLLDELGFGQRTRAKILDLSERVNRLAQRHQLRLHWAVSAPDEPLNLPSRYQSALSAAEEALSQGSALVYASAPAPRAAANPLAEWRRKLAQATRESPAVLAPRFERYIEAVAAHCGYRVDAIRTHLECGIDQVIEALRNASVLDERSLAELRVAIARSAGDAATVGELFAAYRKSIADIEVALARPFDARQDRSLRRAIAYIQEHFAERLTLEQVARKAGFAPGYFSKLFAATERTTFREYTKRLRVERAKQMLSSTTLSAERIGLLCGFRTPNRFHVMFKRLEGATPKEYRSRALQAARNGVTNAP